MVMRLVSGLSLASHRACPIFGLIQGPSQWHTHLPAKMDSNVRASGRLAGHIIFSLILLAPPYFSWLDFEAALHSLSGPPVVVHSSRYHHAWPRQVVSVMGSPTSTSFRHHFFCLKTALPHCVLWNKRPLKHSGGNLWVISLGERLYTISWSRWFLMHIENSEESNSL